MLPLKVENLIQNMKTLPGIGEKSALKMSLFLMNQNIEKINEFVSSLNDIQNIKVCSICGVFCDEICIICTNQKRDKSQICVVESYLDFISIEKGGAFKGTYHILGGVLNPLQGVGPNELRIRALIDRLVNVSENDKVEIILALNPSVEGDATCSYLKDLLPDYIEVSRIGFGIPLGANLEYIDTMTITRALENKKKL